MAEEVPESISPSRIGRLSNLSSMYDPNIFELVWENDQIFIRNLTSKITSKNTGLQCSEYFPSKGHIQHEDQHTFTASRSKDLVSESKLGDSLDRYYDKNKIKSYPNSSPLGVEAAGNPKLFSELYEDDGFNVDTQEFVDSQIVPVNEFKNFRRHYPSKIVDKIPQCILNSDNEVLQSCSKQCEASLQLNISKEKNSETDEKRNRVNFSMFLKSPSLNKTINSSSKAAEGAIGRPGLARADDDLEGCMRSAHMMQFEPTNNNGSKDINVNAILPDSEPQKALLPDQQSEAVGHKDAPQDTKFRNKVHDPSSNLPGNGKFAKQVVPSSSVGSRGASNCPAYTLKKRYEDDSSENVMKEPEDGPKAAAAARRSDKGAKGKRKAEVHNLSKRRRRDKINKKMRALKELIPNCNKMDKASMLDEAIEYLRTLQLQVQMMSMGSGIYMPPNPMIQTAMQQLVNAQQLGLGGGYIPMSFGVGMGMRMQMGVGCSPTQFPTTSVMPLSAPGIAEARFNNMVGYSAVQASLMSMSRSPFVSLSPSQSIHASAEVSQPALAAAAAAAQVEIPASIPLSTSRDSNPTCH